MAEETGSMCFRKWQTALMGQWRNRKITTKTGGFPVPLFFVVSGYKNDVRSGILDVSIECLYNRDKRPRKAYKSPKRIVR